MKFEVCKLISTDPHAFSQMPSPLKNAAQQQQRHTYSAFEKYSHGIMVSIQKNEEKTKKLFNVKVNTDLQSNVK